MSCAVFQRDLWFTTELTTEFGWILAIDVTLSYTSLYKIWVYGAQFKKLECRLKEVCLIPEPKFI